ncbi:MAG: hypothetical protein JWL61_5329 [Gemmatimonadetes bacterium]|jgi:hypothetical protein|nr:hypothetical protein [Gemmatimonadota bacterium]
MTPQPWLLLIHQIPPKPDYFRVKVGRRLQRIGAVAIKNSVYVLPATEQAMEDLQWILREIVDGGGEASICRSTFIDGLTDAEIEGLFQSARARDYDEIAAEARATLKTLRPNHKLNPSQRTAAQDAVAKLRKRFAVVDRVDFFATENRESAVKTLDVIEARLRPRTVESAEASQSLEHDRPRGRTWVTRKGIFVDRIASAWLIRRFIDPDARFKFVAPQGYRAKSAELRFDMFEGEYTHEGDRCTFETLLRRFGIDDLVLSGIAEIVHDIDLSDAKFAREDAVGIKHVLAGIAATCPDDAARLERGSAVFDGLYALGASLREETRK